MANPNKLSRRERWAERTGLDKTLYKKSTEGRTVNEVEKYYEDQRNTVKKKAKIDTTRLAEDFSRVLENAGIEKTRTAEDFQRNIKNLTQNKDADIEDLNYYTRTQNQRTGEDQNTALVKEARRYELEQFKENQALASRNLVFGSLGGIRAREERLNAEQNQMNVNDINTDAQRSFQDIARNEYEKNRDIEMKYNQDVEAQNVKQKRSIEDINWDTQTQKIKNTRGVEDVRWDKKQDLKNLGYNRKDTIRGIEQDYIQMQNAARQAGYEYNYFA